MATITFDTLKAAEGLEAAGMDSRQAKAVVTTMAGAVSDTVATKADIAGLEAKIAELKADMFKVAMGVAIAIILANATMTIALIRFLS